MCSELQMLLREVSADQMFVIHKQCFDVSHDDFIYSLCPFHHIRKRKAVADHSILIGLVVQYHWHLMITAFFTFVDQS